MNERLNQGRRAPRGPLGLIAGGGGLPVEIARACEREGRSVFVIRLKGLTDPELLRFAGVEAGPVELGKCVKALRDAGQIFQGQ